MENHAPPCPFPRARQQVGLYSPATRSPPTPHNAKPGALHRSALAAGKQRLSHTFTAPLAPAGQGSAAFPHKAAHRRSHHTAEINANTTTRNSLASLRQPRLCHRTPQQTRAGTSPSLSPGHCAAKAEGFLPEEECPVTAPDAANPTCATPSFQQSEVENITVPRPACLRPPFSGRRAAKAKTPPV